MFQTTFCLFVQMTNAVVFNMVCILFHDKVQLLNYESTRNLVPINNCNRHGVLTRAKFY